METTIGKRLRHARRACDLTQSELAKQVGISTVTLNRYETGHREMDAALILRISSAVNCSVNWLMTGEGEFHNERPSIPFNTTNSVNVNGCNDPIIADIMRLLIYELPEEKVTILNLLKGKAMIKQCISALNN